TVSSAALPYSDWSGVTFPPSSLNPPEIDVCMPVCYAGTAAARRYFNADWPISVKAMDAVYFATMLRTTSRVHSNMRADQTLMPFISSMVRSPNTDGVPRMSKPMYHEFLRHAILRGARGFYCFNVAPPYGAMTDYYAELADINAVLNEMFAYREFLEGGAPMSHDWPDPKDGAAVVWSGLRLKDRCLVRAFTLGTTARKLDLVPFPKKSVALEAPPEGAIYVIDSRGLARKVGEGL
ncbi:MAG: hypothetical protein PHR35_14275, partial [Kiritimatiellae bacterium]|nr:hypothetical protein [Kiritimatiellia bacterium]